jgi:glutaminyl-tRNA synthetase
MYERLFTVPHPDAGDGDFRDLINTASKHVLRAMVEPTLAQAAPDDKFQFERLGYFVADRVDHRAEAPVFNLAVTLRGGA